MITYVFGKTGSGKSYKAVTLILKELETRPVYSNIELVKYVAGYNYLHADMMRSWMSFIEELYNKSQTDLTPEEEIYTQLRNRGISNCSVFIDEAHIYGFNNTKKKDFLMFFLALQRHVGLNIFLITQTRKQLNSIFHDLGDTIISCVSPTERLIENVLEYRYFSHVDMIRDISSAYKNEKVLPKDDIFALYKSGDKNTGDAGFRNKLKMLVVGVIIVIIFLVIQFRNLMGGADVSDDVVSQQSLEVDSPGVSSSVSRVSDNTYILHKYMVLSCVLDRCVNEEYSVDLSVNDLNYTITHTSSDLLSFIL